MTRRGRLSIVLAAALLASGGTGARQQMQTYEEARDEGRRLLAQGYHGEALRAFQRAERIAGGADAPCRVLLARTHNARRAFDEAVAEARRALELRPGEPWLSRARLELGRGLLGRADAATGKRTLREAELALRRVLAAGLPEAHEARLPLGELLLRRGRVEGARELLRAFVEAEPSGAAAERARLLLERPYCAREACAPAFSATTTTGATIESRDLLGRVVLLDFWATWCSPCIAALPELERLRAELAGAPVVFVGINMDPDERALHEFLERQPIDWPQVWDGDDFALSHGRFDVYNLPTYLVIDARGVVRARVTGAGPQVEAELERQLRSAARGGS